MDLATLGIGVESSGLEQANEALDKFTATAGKAEAAAGGLETASGKSSRATAEMAKEIDKAVEQYDEIIGQMQEEGEVLASTLDAKSDVLQARRDEVDAIAQQSQSTKDLVDAIQDEVKVQQEQEQAAAAAAKAVDDLSDAQDDLVDSTSQYSAEVKKTLDDLKHEYDLIGKTTLEKRKMNELRKAGVTAASEEGKAIEKAVEAVDRETKALERSEKVRSRVVLAVSAMAAAIGTTLVIGITSAVTRLENHRTMLDKYTQALQQMGSETEITADKFKQFAVDLEMSTGRAMEDVLALGANAASFGFDDEVFKGAITLANDMAAAWGGDLRQNFEGLARALDDPIKGFAMLRQRGISLTDTQANLVQKLIDTNQKLEAQRYVMQVLGEQVGGVAAAGFTGLTRAWANMTLAANGFFESIVQGTGLMGGLETALNVITGLLIFMTDNLAASIPILTTVGITLAAVFGPTVIAAIQTVATWIGAQLVKSVLAFNAALLANPIAIVAAALIGIMVYMVDWERSITNLIILWGKLVQTIGTALNALGFGTSLAERGLQIQINAQSAARDLVSAGEEMKRKITGGMSSGGDDAAAKVEDGMKRGGTAAADAIVSAQDSAMARYEEMNGKTVQEIGKVMMDGGKYWFNQATGEITKAADKSAQTMSTGIQDGGGKAAGTMGKAIEKAGASISYNLSSAMSDAMFAFKQGATDLFTSWDQMNQIVNAQIKTMMAEARKLNSEATLANQQAMAIRNQNYGTGTKDRGGYGGGGGSGSEMFGSGGGGVYTSGVGGSGAGGLSGAEPAKLLSGSTYVKGIGYVMGLSDKFKNPASPGVLSEQTNMTENGKITIVNVTDPSQVPAAMGTQSGGQTILNTIRNNREEILAILGVAN